MFKVGIMAWLQYHNYDSALKIFWIQKKSTGGKIYDTK